MINGKTVLAIIPARGGSKGVPRKNIREVCGKPLIAWTVEVAQKSVYIDRLILSTEDDEIASVGRAYGCEVPFMRPKELAHDHTPGIDPVLHVLEIFDSYDYVVLLQPTSPFRNVSDIDGSIEKCLQSNAKSCVAMTLSDKTPYWMYFLDGNSRMKPVLRTEQTITRRQDAPNAYVINGAIYVAECRWLKSHQSFLSDETVAYIMPKERSLDIDSEIDFFIMEHVLKNRNKINW
ncbi:MULTISPECIES: cytidylyltransferase domain-containing protein [unclassified Brevibacillus]|uniref:acylneuraminate cytidylyltransferase family protein n=1 Tax=unclassified Brevibacillus TaxID=2684853 RepID=UPI0035657814